MTINESWGYQGADREFKSANQIIRIFTDCLNLGGNLLLDIGPVELYGDTGQVITSN